METKNFLGLDGLKRFWEKAKIWIINEITTKIAEIVAEAPEDLNTLKEISDWISTHKDSASAMNTNIIKNQSDINELSNKLSSIEQTNFKAIFDLVRPIGDTYVQYPQQANPNELWGAFSTWQVINYDGAFFRAEGTNANAFIEKTGVLTKQAELVGSHSDWVNVSGGNHRHAFHGSDDWQGGVGVDTEGNGQYSGITYYTDYSGDLSMSGTVTHNATENRPANYTYRIWKRTS